MYARGNRRRYHNAATQADGIGVAGYAGGSGNGVSAPSIANDRRKCCAAFDETARLDIIKTDTDAIRDREGKRKERFGCDTMADAANGGGLSNDTLLDMYAKMTLSRALDERIWMLNRQGKAAIVASSQGHEAAQIGSAYALRRGTDLFYIYYRDLAVMLTLGMTPREIMLGFTAKDGEPLSGARQFPTHGAYPELGLVNLSNVVATQLPQAVGAALALRMRREDALAIVYFGDGASSVGDTHEAMNFAAIHKLPVIFFCENNKYATSVPLHRQMAVESLASRAEGYGMPGVSVDGCDVVAVYETTIEAMNRARDGDGPTLIEAQVERYLPHTSDDDDTRYRPRSEIEEARKRDPLALFGARLFELGILDDAAAERLRGDALAEVNAATDFVETAAYPQTHDFMRYVYAE